MTEITELLLDVLVDLVETVLEHPRRVLFKGVSDLSEPFRERIERDSLSWDVRVTREGEDVVAARNDAAIPTLVVFYRDEVRERESLNAFRQFDEDNIAETLVRHVAEGKALADSYATGDIERLRSLLDLVYPSVGQLAAFLLAGKENVGLALPYLGLFADPILDYGQGIRQWKARNEENHKTAVLRWREFLEKGQRRKDARRLLGDARLRLLKQAETDPAAKQPVLEQVNLVEAIRILNPPTRLVEGLMREGLGRDEAEQLVADIKAGLVDPSNLGRDIPPLPERLTVTLKKLKPLDEEDEDEAGPEAETRQVGFCLEGLLGLARHQAPFPRELCLARADVPSEDYAKLKLTPGGQWDVELTASAARALSQLSPEASELQFRIFEPEQSDKSLFHFSIKNLSGWLEPFAEIWPSQGFWTRAAALAPEHRHAWARLQECIVAMIDVVDPDWKKEQEQDDVEPEREPNNPIYMIFDMLYLAHRDLFEAFLDAWLEVATLPWNVNVTPRLDEWRKTVEELLQIGLARRPDGSLAVLPFHPLRLAWHRTVFAQIEQWLADATRAYAPRTFEPNVLADQFQSVERPHALIHDGARLMEASAAPFFSIFVPEDRQRRARAPLERARQKLEQFGRMWPFSLARLHLAFQPGDAGADVYRLLEQEAERQRDAAFRVRALVDNTGVMTAFDEYLLTTGDETTDLLTQEYHESMLPRVDYAKGRLEADEELVAAHAALLVDIFREEDFGFTPAVGQLSPHPHWTRFGELVRAGTAQGRERLKNVSLTTPPYHSSRPHDGRRDLVYVSLGEEPEYLKLLFDSLSAWLASGDFTQGAAYYERVSWDAEALKRIHHRADWVILFDRALDKSLFEQLGQEEGIRLIDFYPDLRGGYRLSVSSRRTDAVQWQLVQVLHQFFGGSNLDLSQVASEMLENLAEFASGLLLKTLGGGSLAQELLGLYGTYLALIADGEFDPAHDWLIPLDNYQSWFGRRTQKGRRADLLVLRTPAPDRLEMLAVESKWYKQPVSIGFVGDEFGADGQLRTTVRSLHSLFDPQQDRLDRDYWQRTLAALLDEAPESWSAFRQRSQSANWELEVDGLVYVHQYAELESERLAERESDLGSEIGRLITPEDAPYFCRGPAFRRLRLEAYPQLVELLASRVPRQAAEDL